jgi:hypothetical protein
MSGDIKKGIIRSAVDWPQMVEPIVGETLGIVDLGLSWTKCR